MAGTYRRTLPNRSKQFESPQTDLSTLEDQAGRTGIKVEGKGNLHHPSKDGTLWIGSNGYGFYKSSPTENGEYTFRSFTTEDGLINNSVRCISEDKEGYLWITTTNGLSRFNPNNNSFFNYTRKDGLLSNQFYWNAICRAANGDLYVGSTKGLSVVKPVIDTNPKEAVPLAFTHVRVANEERLYTNGTLQLHERDKSLYIEFAALDYDASTFANYYYRLKGFDDKWIKVPANRRQAAYTNLRPGNYTFELRYAPDGKQWLEEWQNSTLPYHLISIKPSGSFCPYWFFYLSLYIRYYHGGFVR